MLFKFRLKIVWILLVISFVVINAKNYKNYNKKTTPKPTPKPTTKPTPKPTTAKPKPTTTQKPYYYPSAQTSKPSKPSATTSKGMPYKFEYSANVGSPDPTGMIAQSESGDSNGVVTGMYSLRDPDGRERTVIYKADSTGFHATVETNELPPDIPNPADVVIKGTGPIPAMSSGTSESPSSSSQSGTEAYSTEGYGTREGGYY